MSEELLGQRVAFVVANEGIEQVELTRPWEAVKGAGGQPELIAPKAGEAQAFNHLDKADTFPVDRTTSEVSVDEYDAIVLPGGVANPDQLRMDEPAVGFIRGMIDAGKPVAVICHGPWTVVEADRVRDRTLTSWPSLKTDIRNAGGTWVDREVQVCTVGPNVLVTSRKPDDLDAFCSTLVRVFQQERASAA
jgi:protease I